MAQKVSQEHWGTYVANVETQVKPKLNKIHIFLTFVPRKLHEFPDGTRTFWFFVCDRPLSRLNGCGRSSLTRPKIVFIKFYVARANERSKNERDEIKNNQVERGRRREHILCLVVCLC